MALQEAGICVRCGKEARQHTDQSYCDGCFCQVVEKRIKKTLRGSLREGQKVLFISNFTKDVFDGIEHIPIEAIVRDFGFFHANDIYGLLESEKFSEFVANENISLVFLSWTADFEAADFLESFFSGKNIKIQAGIQSKIIKLFKDVNEKELEIFAGIKGMKYEKGILPKSAEFLAQLEGEYQGLRFATIKSKEIIEKALGENKKKIMENENDK